MSSYYEDQFTGLYKHTLKRKKRQYIDSMKLEDIDC